MYPRRSGIRTTSILPILTATWFASFLFGPRPTNARETEGGIFFPPPESTNDGQGVNEEEEEEEPEDHDEEDDVAVWFGATKACPESENVEVEESLRIAREASEDADDDDDDVEDEDDDTVEEVEA